MSCPELVTKSDLIALESRLLQALTPQPFPIQELVSSLVGALPSPLSEAQIKDAVKAALIEQNGADLSSLDSAFLSIEEAIQRALQGIGDALREIFGFDFFGGGDSGGSGAGQDFPLPSEEDAGSGGGNCCNSILSRLSRQGELLLNFNQEIGILSSKISRLENSLNPIALRVEAIQNYFAFIDSLLGDISTDLKRVAKVTGVDDFPGKLPNSLLGDDDLKGITTVESLPQFLLWLTKQLDALVGEFPIEIEVADNDLTQSGNQRETIKLRNIAEALAELYGQGVLTTTHQFAQTNGLVRVGTELTSLKVMVAIAQDLIMATTEFLGFKTKQKNREINTSFRVKKSSDKNYTVATFLDADRVSYKGYEFDDDDILIEYLPQLMYGVSLIKAATLRGEDDINEIEKQVKEVLEDGKTAWDKFKETVNNPDSEYNLEQDIQFRIIDRDVEIEE